MTYWSEDGAHQAKADVLEKMIPAEGEVPDASRNPALKRFRVASNIYYDLYNNGLANCTTEFRDVFGFDAEKYRADEESHFDDRIFSRVEKIMDKIVLAANAEQFPPIQAQ